MKRLDPLNFILNSGQFDCFLLRLHYLLITTNKSLAIAKMFFSKLNRLRYIIVGDAYFPYKSIGDTQKMSGKDKEGDGEWLHLFVFKFLLVDSSCDFTYHFIEY